MIKAIIAVSTILVAAFLLSSVKPQADDFSLWKTKFGATFSPDEETYRKEVFTRNSESINHHNGLLGTSYKMGVNQFTSLTHEEFV